MAMNIRDPRGFTLMELMVSTAITLTVLATAMTTFRNTLLLNESATLLADSNQNLRAGTNLMVRDLMSAGRRITVGGIPIPSGDGVGPINRPSPPTKNYKIDNINETVLPSVYPGLGLGPNIDGRVTDMVSFMMVDTTLLTDPNDLSTWNLQLNPHTGAVGDAIQAGDALLADDGSFIDVGNHTNWLTDAVNGVKEGDLILFKGPSGDAIQTVTRTDTTRVYFEANDWFNFNQRTAPQGTIMQTNPNPGGRFPATQAMRVLMLSYYVDNETTVGTPRLTRRINYQEGKALAGVVEDLEISYDLVDGVTNPTAVKNPATPSQIRKVNLHMGVRSDTRSGQSQDFIRQHINTVVSLRSLAFVDRYK